MIPPEVHEILKDTFGSRHVFVTGHTGFKGSWLCLWGGGSCRVDGQAQPHEARWLQLDCHKARTRLGWRPQYDVWEALSLSIDFYRWFYEKAAPAELYRLTESQIAAYLAVGDGPGYANQSGTGIL